METIKIGIAFRPACEADINFIINSWMKSQRHAWCWEMPDQELYYKMLEDHIKHTLNRCSAVVAYDPADPFSIYGYICGEHYEDTAIIHYVYVKQVFRRFGIARLMYETAMKGFNEVPIVTSFTKTIESLRKIKGLNYLYNPWIIEKLDAMETKSFTETIK